MLRPSLNTLGSWATRWNKINSNYFFFSFLMGVIFETFSCKALVIAVSISAMGISIASFQFIRTSLYITGFGFPLNPPSSAMAEVQNRSITEKITWARKEQAGFQHTCCWTHHPYACPSHSWRVLCDQWGHLSALPRSWPMRIRRKQNYTKKRFLTKEPLTTDPVSEQVRKTKKSSFISQFGLEMEDESKLWNHLARQERASGNISSITCFLLSAAALSSLVSFSMCHCLVESRGYEVEVRVPEEESAQGYLYQVVATWQETWLWEAAAWCALTGVLLC